MNNRYNYGMRTNMNKHESRLRGCLKTPPGRRVRARGLQDFSESVSSCRPGALTGRVFKQPLRNALAIALFLIISSAVTSGAAPVKVRLGTLAPKGSSYTKHLQVMGEQWRSAPGGGALLTIYPDGTMGSEADMVRRMRLGQLQAAMVTAAGLSEIEPGVAGLQAMPKVFRTLEEVDAIDEKM